MFTETTKPVSGCARCGGDHDAVTFRPFTRSNPTYQSWALCPVNGEPILERCELIHPDGTVQRLNTDEAAAWIEAHPRTPA